MAKNVFGANPFKFQPHLHNMINNSVFSVISVIRRRENVSIGF
jgi:hypothetical protein